MTNTMLRVIIILCFLFHAGEETDTRIVEFVTISPGTERHELSGAGYHNNVLQSLVDSSFNMPNSVLVVIQVLDDSDIVCPYIPALD